tara:strand:- start:386 stop:592 length:207 start_codon:yes stop_codon:yes gene_type:complete
MKKIETNLNDELRYERLIRDVQKLDRDQILEVVKDLARLALIMQPAAIRWATGEAVSNLVDQWNDPKN